MWRTLPAQVDADVRRVAAAAGQRRRAHLPRARRGRRPPGWPGCPARSARRGGRRRRRSPPASTTARRRRRRAACRATARRHAERRLQPEHPRRGVVDRALLVLGRVRRVVGGDGVDRPVGQPGLEGGDVGGRAQRRVDLEHRVVAAQRLVGERRGGAASTRPSRAARRPWPPARASTLRAVDRCSRWIRAPVSRAQLDVAVDHQLLGDAPASRAGRARCSSGPRASPRPGSGG